jgi:hypothetical protein
MFSGAQVDLVLHATEDGEKVLAAVEKTLAVPAASFSGEQSEGHYGNRISLLRAEVQGEDATRLAKKVVATLNSADRHELADHLEEYSDEKGNLYLRLDKQRICQGRVSLAEADAVKIRFRPVRRFGQKDIDTYRGLFSSAG